VTGNTVINALLANASPSRDRLRLAAWAAGSDLSAGAYQALCADDSALASSFARSA
jgi:hypothetical protein